MFIVAVALVITAAIITVGIVLMKRYAKCGKPKMYLFLYIPILEDDLLQLSCCRFDTFYSLKTAV